LETKDIPLNQQNEQKVNPFKQASKEKKNGKTELHSIESRSS